MYSKVYSAALAGMDSFLTCVETDVSDGLPHVDMVGMLSAEAREARERVRTALKNLGIRIPPKRVTISLSPAEKRKEGTAFDLAMTAGILLALGLVPGTLLAEAVVVGEVRLDGAVLGIRGVLAMAYQARESGMKRIFVPQVNAGEGAAIDGIDVVAVGSVEQLFRILKGELPCQAEPVPDWNQGECQSQLDFSQVGGQQVLKRAAEVACAGMHNFLMVGQAGSGKSMISQRIPTILPALTREESIQISTIYSVSGLLAGEKALKTVRPYRSPHHTITQAGLAGGGRIPAPGEISLAHGGVLFLDELTEFRPEILETLRQPMEDHRLTIVRSGVSYTFPADFMLVAAMNPCKCGYYPDRNLCRCTEKEVRAYLNRLSRPLLDRMDICVEVSRASYEELHGGSETSASIRSRVEQAYEIQKRRFQGTEVRFNARIPASCLDEYCPMEEKAERFLKRIYEKMSLSTRGLHSIRRVARTIADLDQSEQIRQSHLSEAVLYRSVQDRLWGNQTGGRA